MPHCLNCGAEMEPDSAFCMVCGTPAGATRPVARAATSMPTIRTAALIALIGIGLNTVLSLLGLLSSIQSMLNYGINLGWVVTSLLSLIFYNGGIALFLAAVYAHKSI